MPEHLLLLLFALFGAIAALLARRKRKREQEKRRPTLVPDREVAAEQEEEEGEFWPFPMGGDPFEPSRPTPRPRQERVGSRPTGMGEAPAEAGAERPAMTEGREAGPARPHAGPAPQPVEVSLAEELQRRAEEATRQALEIEQRVQREARRLREVQPRRRVEDLVRERMAPPEEKPPQKAATKGRWTLTPQSAKDAIVYAEILGLPKAQRSEEYFR